MADIRPFRGMHYNPALVKDLTDVICPPYDIISPRMQQELYQFNDHNFVRIEYGHELPHDDDKDNKYTRAAATLEKWLRDRVLVTDDSPSIYIHEYYFRHRGETYHRRNINCLVKLEEWDRMIVRPHEGTLSRPKGDRLNLLWALQANTSPIMTLYEDQGKVISAQVDAQTQGKPILSAGDMNGESHRLWIIEDERTIGQISDALAGQPLYIADGHHRYESALTYQHERRSCSQSTDGEQPFDFVMMTLMDFTDPGLIILPAHRLVRGLPQATLEGLMDSLQIFFKVEELPPDTADSPTHLDKLLAEGPGEVRLLLYDTAKDCLFRLTLSDFRPVKPMMPYFHSELYQRLDVSIVDHVILEKLLGLTHEAAGTYLDYTDDVLEAIRSTRENEYQMALIVKPVAPQTIKSIADSGDRMPHKSTYFYPKAPAGLVVYRLD